MCETLHKAIQEEKDKKSHINQIEGDNASFYKPILDDDVYLQSLDDIIDLYYKIYYQENKNINEKYDNK